MGGHAKPPALATAFAGAWTTDEQPAQRSG